MYSKSSVYPMYELSPSEHLLSPEQISQPCSIILHGGHEDVQDLPKNMVSEAPKKGLP